MRTKARKDQLGEVFTPPALVNEILNHLPDNTWKDSTKTILDPTCGNGNFLVEAFNRLIQYHTKEDILDHMLYGADIMDDNCQDTIKRLYGDGEIIRLTNIPEDFQTNGIIACYTHNGNMVKNIVQADGLLYDYSFNHAKEERVEKEKEDRLEQERIKMEKSIKKVTGTIDNDAIAW